MDNNINTEDNNYILWEKDRIIGELCYTTDGRLAEIIDIGSSGKWNDLTLLYDDELVEEHKSINYFGGYYFNEGFCGRKICHPLAHYTNPWYFGFTVYSGRMKRQKNGLIAQVIPFQLQQYSSLVVTIKWEDGEIEIVNKTSFAKGTCRRKDLRKDSCFHGFIVHKLITKRTKGKAYYEAECTICKHKSLMTPQQMLEHSKTHNSYNSSAKSC